MRAAFLTEYGPADLLEVRDTEDPSPEDYDLLVTVKAASVNPIDTKIRGGTQRAIIRYSLPWILGLDVAGVVEAVGAKVTKFKVGDEICASLNYKRPGAYAEKVLVHQDIAATKPKNASFEEAAALPLAGLTAWQSLAVSAGLKEGQRVFIQAGAGGVGHLAIQIGKILGAHVATTCSTRNVDFVKSMGADEVVDYTQDQYDEVLSNFDVVLDSLGGEHRKRALASLKKGGKHVSIVSDMPANVKKRGPYLGVLTSFIGVGGFMLCARTQGIRSSMVVQSPHGEQLDKLCRYVESGVLKVVIDKSFKLEDIVEAHKASESGRTVGKVVVTP